MRLRSSQFVFLMLLICSVQVREECSWHLADGAVTNRTAAAAAQHRATASPSARRMTRLCVELERLTPSMRLDSAAREAHQTPWTMAQPAQESASVVSFTSYLRG